MSNQIITRALRKDLVKNCAQTLAGLGPPFVTLLEKEMADCSRCCGTSKALIH